MLFMWHGNSYFFLLSLADRVHGVVLFNPFRRPFLHEPAFLIGGAASQNSQNSPNSPNSRSGQASAGQEARRTAGLETGATIWRPELRFSATPEKSGLEHRQQGCAWILFTSLTPVS